MPFGQTDDWYVEVEFELFEYYWCQHKYQNTSCYMKVLLCFLGGTLCFVLLILICISIGCHCCHESNSFRFLTNHLKLCYREQCWYATGASLEHYTSTHIDKLERNSHLPGVILSNRFVDVGRSLLVDLNCHKALRLTLSCKNMSEVYPPFLCPCSDDFRIRTAQGKTR